MAGLERALADLRWMGVIGLESLLNQINDNSFVLEVETSHLYYACHYRLHYNQVYSHCHSIVINKLLSLPNKACHQQPRYLLLGLYPSGLLVLVVALFAA